jgi:hypothetical protein
MKEQTNINNFLKNVNTAIVVLLIAIFFGSTIYIGISCFMNN